MGLAFCDFFEAPRVLSKLIVIDCRLVGVIRPVTKPMRPARSVLETRASEIFDGRPKKLDRQFPNLAKSEDLRCHQVNGYHRLELTLSLTQTRRSTSL